MQGKLFGDEGKRLTKDQRIVFNFFPVPPSVNKIYKHFYDKRKKKIVRASEKCLIEFKKTCEVYAMANKRLCDTAHTYLVDEPHISVTVYVALHEDRIFTKDGKVRQMDVTNFGKALYDCLSTMIGVDDRHFADVRIVKVVAPFGTPEHCRIELGRCGLGTLA